MTVQTSVAAAEPLIPGRTRRLVAQRVFLYGALVVIALVYFTPFVWSLATSFKTLPQTAFFNFIPRPFTTDAWKSVWTDYDFKRYALNSAFLAATVTVLNLFLASLGGYAFARLRFPGREVLFLLVLATLMIPDQLRLVPLFVMLTNLHLIGTYQGYFAINLVHATSLFLMRQYFVTIPKDFEEAAKLDAAGYFKTFWRVMLPLAGPALAAVTILTFQGTWNDFYWPLIIFQEDPSKFPLPLGISHFKDLYQTLWPQLMAASVITILPIAILYVFFQRYFVAGVAAAGVKG
jgi:multiple sugar transport system permease protein